MYLCLGLSLSQGSPLGSLSSFCHSLLFLELLCHQSFPLHIPQGGPQPPVVPGIDRSPIGSPVIPTVPPGWGGMAMPEPGTYMGPILAAGAPFAEYHLTGSAEFVHRMPEPDDERVIPSTPTSVSRSPLLVPDHGAIVVEPSPGHGSRASTPTQESYDPPHGPGVRPVPRGNAYPMWYRSNLL